MKELVGILMEFGVVSAATYPVKDVQKEIGKNNRREDGRELLIKIGDINYTKYGTPFKIIEKHKKSQVLIEFQDQFKMKKLVYNENFKDGNVKNPYDRSVAGVGYLGEGKYMAKVNDVLTVEYTDWKNMIRRCYDENERHLHLTYQDCYVADMWHNFQTFANWYDENIYKSGSERVHIDKDILYKNNKFYSPETCLMVPQRINMLFIKKIRITDSDLPTGIRRCEDKFKASYNTIYLGIFDSVTEAMIPYNNEKRKHIIELANEYINIISPKTYDALCNWIPDSSVRIA